MPLRLFNTLTRRLEEFRPLDPAGKRVGLYVCGPTVYDVPHIGHARSAFIFDVLRRYLAFRGYQVTFVRNVTDVDDKIIAKARAELGTRDTGHGTGDALTAKCKEVAERYLKSYYDALDRLGIERPTLDPKATEHVVPDPKNIAATKKIDASMTGFISQLMTQNMAYPSGGDVYFSVRRYADYGKLSNRSIDELQAGARVESGEQKEDPLDFALWKAAKPDEPSWNSPWGPGRPGWHIECSVMSTAYLGDAFDIHGGGVDLVFPHHENELAQARALGKPFAKYWVHNGLLTVNGEKMSKSLGNFITVGQALKDAHGNVNALKVFFLSSHYRSPVDYSEKNLRAAAGRANRWYDYLFAADSQRSSAGVVSEAPEILKFHEEFTSAMDDDLNTPQALAALDRLANLGYEWWKELEAGSCGPSDIRTLRSKIVSAADAIFALAKLLGLELAIFRQSDIDPVIKALLVERETARKAGDFKTADQKRDEVFQKGFMIRDTFGGPIAIPIAR